MRAWLRRRVRLLAILLAALLSPGLAWTVAVRARGFPVGLIEPRGSVSLTVLDRQGEVLRQQATTGGGRATWVALERVSPHLVAATVAAEDHRFYRHAGVDPLGVLRAAWLDLRSGSLSYGGSTLTMQLVRLLEPRRGRQGLAGKLVEAVLASRLEGVLGKSQILEQYLNRAYYGNSAWGAEAAATLYFGKPAAALSAGEAALLAVLPRGPTLYDPYRNLNLTLARRGKTLGRMQELGLLAPAEAALARATPVQLRRDQPGFRAPHFAEYALAAVPEAERPGATVETTLDGPLQERLEVSLRAHLAQVGGRHITQAGLVVLRNRDGAILALLGSADYFDARRAGAVDVLTLRRRPGSTLKPFVYGLALERGDTPASVAFDVILPHEALQAYTADVRQHGFARFRESLAGSYNLAAIHTLERVGVATLLARLRQAGLHTLDSPDSRYDSALAIGEAEVTLLELTGAFAAFGNQGRPVRPRAVERVLLPVLGPPIFQDQDLEVFDLRSGAVARPAAA